MVKLTKKYIRKAHKRPGGSNVGKARKTSGAGEGPFVGPSGGAPAGSYPVTNPGQAHAALSYARHAPNPSGIRAAVRRIMEKRGWGSKKRQKKQEGGTVNPAFDLYGKAVSNFAQNQGGVTSPYDTKARTSGGGIIGTIGAWGASLGEGVEKALKSRVEANAPEASDIRNTGDIVKEMERVKKGTHAAELGAAFASGNIGDILGTGIEQIFGGKQHKKEEEEATRIGSRNAITNYLLSSSVKSYKKGGKVRKKGGIHIKPENRGKFTAYKKRTGKTTSEALNSKNPHVRQMANFARNSVKWHHAEGGVVTGKGGAKSDDINMKAAAGAFIVPAENKTVAQRIGKEMLGWNRNQKAKKVKEGIPIKVSDGEVEYTPDEVATLERHGIDVDKLAPNAEKRETMKRGGSVKRYKTHPTAAKAAEMIKNPPGGKELTPRQDRYFRALEHRWNPNKKKSSRRKGYKDGGDVNYGMKGKLGAYAKPPASTGPTTLDQSKYPWLKNLWGFAKEHPGEIAAGLQAITAGISLANMGPEPALTIANELRQVARETAIEKQYGLEPFIYDKTRADLIRARNEERRILSSRGGGGQDLQKSLSVANERYAQGLINLAASDFAAQEAKKAVNRDWMERIAMRKDVIEGSRIDKYRRNEEALAGMLSAGLENFGGAIQYRKTLDRLKDIQYDPTKLFS